MKNAQIKFKLCLGKVNSNSSLFTLKRTKFAFDTKICFFLRPAAIFRIMKGEQYEVVAIEARDRLLVAHNQAFIEACGCPGIF
jgi:hypothetical protein